MVRKATKRDVQAIIELLHQVDMVHHVIPFMMMVKSLVMPSV